MKFPYLLFIFLFIGGISVSKAQKYHVMNVKGVVIHMKSKQNLAPGIEIDATDELRFASQDAKVMVANASNGRQLLDGSKSKKNAKGEFMAFVSDVMMPSTTSLQLSTRGGENAEIKNFKDYFGTETFYIVGNELNLKIDPNVYPLSDTRFVACIYKSSFATAKKKVIQSGSTLTFSGRDLYVYRGQDMDMNNADKMSMYYYNSETEEGVELTSVKLMFINEEDLLSELKNLVKYYQSINYTEDKIKKEVVDYFVEAYGKTDKEVLIKWLKQSDLLK